MVDGNQIRASGKCTLDLDFGQCGRDGGEDVAASEHGAADCHEVCYGVVAIADELLLY